MKRLCRVDVEFSGYVMAESEVDARRFAPQIADDLHLAIHAYAHEVKHTDRLDPEWGEPVDEPYGDDGLTLAEAWPKSSKPPPMFLDLVAKEKS